MSKCIGCGVCAEKCPKKVADEYNQGLAKRKATHVKYPQTVPLKYAIDVANCIYFKKGTCKACEKVCPSGAIKLDDTEKILTTQVGAVVLAAGFQTFDPHKYPSYHYANFPNVITSLEFERILSATGPYGGHLVRPSDHQEPKKIAWLQCVGSRDIKTHSYCSAVCCMYAIKEAVIAKEHCKEYSLDTAIFFMDMRTFGKDFELYYNRAEKESGVRFIRSRIHSIDPAPGDNLRIKYRDESGEQQSEEFDLVVLSVGMELSDTARRLVQTVEIDLNKHPSATPNRRRRWPRPGPAFTSAGPSRGPRTSPSPSCRPRRPRAQ